MFTAYLKEKVSKNTAPAPPVIKIGWRKGWGDPPDLSANPRRPAPPPAPRASPPRPRRALRRPAGSDPSLQGAAQNSAQSAPIAVPSPLALPQHWSDYTRCFLTSFSLFQLQPLHPERWARHPIPYHFGEHSCGQDRKDAIAGAPHPRSEDSKFVSWGHRKPSTGPVRENTPGGPASRPAIANQSD